MTDHDAVADRLAITDVLLRYFRGLDRRDYPSVRSCFTEDARLTYAGAFDGDTEEFMQWVSSDLILGGLVRTMHFAGNMYVDVDGDGADTEVYAVAYHESPPEHRWEGQFVTMWLRYIDRLERRPDGWRIVRRQTVTDWRRSDPPQPA